MMSFGEAVYWPSGLHGRDDAGGERDEARVRRDFWRKVRQGAAGVPVAAGLLAPHYCAFDAGRPLQGKAILGGARPYFVLPVGVVPDLVPLGRFPRAAAPPPTT